MREVQGRIGAIAIFLLVAAAGCGDSDEGQPGDRVLARVHTRELRLAELEGMFPRNATPEDSTIIIDAFVGRWVRDAVMIEESESKLRSDMNIDRLVRDYRASLVRSSFERALVDELLDSTITREELETYYENSKEQYQLETPIVRCFFIKVPYPTPEVARLRELWNNGQVKDTTALEKYCRDFAIVGLVNTSAWYSLEEVARQLPEGTLTTGNVNSKREFTQQDGQYQYYFKLFETRNRREIAPLGYIEEQARKVILHNRKLQLLETAKEEIFERELRRNNVETFTN